ncbi:uncharacterized protein LOC111367052 [Olea europaea var. sylvestris]|uniref:Uncharacterized protein n=1 Tax=Olea europaea subsp. europaea TaxID=158383 RepID=A0A8S0U2N0_OLEEU|nr:uncharacterized protein LOC111367052 [Olea europaea var. sylvestris]CAA3013149.1 Hypothetical predicted protein [Olea europaea subsp. europaea]
MDSSPVHPTPSVEVDEWDTDGFVIPSLGIGYPDQNQTDSPKVEDSKPSTVQANKEEKIYLGPHGAPPSQSKLQELNSSSRKQRLRQKLKEADRQYCGTGRENKVDNLRELVGGGRMSSNTSKSSRDWLDPHCHESQFERRRLR